MNVYQLKLKARRSLAFGMAVGMLGITGSTALPVVVHADALNPLTERTLLLSSSSPGHHYLDAAGNTTYAAPGSGPNGKQTGQTFSFKVSTNSSASGFGAKNEAIKAFTFQYCTSAAGICKAPGSNNTNLNVHYGTGAIASDPGDADGQAPVQNVDFLIYVGNSGTPEAGTDWQMTVSNHQEGATGPLTTNNFITLANASSTLKPTAGTAIKIVFKASAKNYITNPEQGAFFVRINDYKSEDPANHVPNAGSENYIIDGGVTVANVMTDSIEIRTKVLETMSFSVGTTNPDTVNPEIRNGQNATHGPCDAIDVNTPLYMGSSQAEFSLEVQTAYDTHSYWRLSSNSSNGASVYYSGYTLSNTVGDQIDAMSTKGPSQRGREQFGLAFDTTADTMESDPSDTDAGGASTPRAATTNPNSLLPLVAQTNYASGAGTINGGSGTAAQFYFDTASDQIPSLLATDDSGVVGCTTGKMRYLGNIAAVTPAGIYASKVNYLAAPQY